MVMTPHASTAGGSIPGQGTKIPHATQHSQKKKKKEFSEGVIVGWGRQQILVSASQTSVHRLTQC